MIVPGSLVARRADLAVPDLALDRITFRMMPRPMELIVGRQAAAMTLHRIVLVRSDRFDDVVSGAAPELAAHELVHVRQWLHHGPVRFLIAYAVDYLRLRLLGLGHRDAYRHIGFEWAAYAEAAHIVRPR